MLYWDANASSRIRPVAVEVVSTLLSDGRPLNPSSVHAEGRYARALLRESRQKIISCLGLSSGKEGDLCFVSGGTEAANSMVFGFCPLHEVSLFRSPPHIISTTIEHAAMLEPIRVLESAGVKVDLISPDRDGYFSPESFVSSLGKDTVIVSIMAANNETGICSPVIQITKALREAGYSGAILSDACQIPGKSSCSISEMFDAGVDAVSVSAHKMGALPGIGAILFNTASSCRLFQPLIQGGPQEGRKRGGTEFVLGAVAWGAVSEYLLRNEENERAQRKKCRDLLYVLLQEHCSGVSLYGDLEYSRLDNTLLLRIEGCRADDLIVALDLEGLCVSMGAACSSGKQDVSHVLMAMGVSKEHAKESIRISLDWDVTEEQVHEGVAILKKAIERMRELYSAACNEY